MTHLFGPVDAARGDVRPSRLNVTDDAVLFGTDGDGTWTPTDWHLQHLGSPEGPMPRWSRSGS